MDVSSQQVHYRAWVFGALAGLLVLVFAEWLIRLESSRAAQLAQGRLQAEASAVRARIESDVTSTLSVGLAAAAFAAAHPEIRVADYERLAQTLLLLQPRLRNLALAPDNVVRHVFPREGNEAVRGVDLEQLPEQAALVRRLRTERRPLTAGPVPLVQGGLGLISRVPVLKPGDDGRLYYWGHAAAVVDVVHLFEQAGLAAEGDILYALRGRDGTGADGPVFLGAPALFDDATALHLDILVPGGKWQMAARWRDAGAAAGWRAWPWHALALALSALTVGLVMQLLRSQQRLAVLASHDSLTGLANRRHFLDMAEAYRALAERQQRQFVLLNLDLEDFKCINDDFGHEVGDAMLVHVAGQARGCLRASDLISRFGGDEFLVLLPDMAPGEELEQLVARLREAVAVPLPVNGRSLRVGLTIGMASFPAHGRSLPELMRAADAQMYESKRQRGPRARR